MGREERGSGQWSRKLTPEGGSTTTLRMPAAAKPEKRRRRGGGGNEKSAVKKSSYSVSIGSERGIFFTLTILSNNQPLYMFRHYY